MKFRFLLITIVCLSASCNSDDEKIDPSSKEYFPLEIGNYWKLEPADNYGFGGEYEVTGTAIIHGKQYFAITVNHTMDGAPSGTSMLYTRVDERAYVFTLIDSLSGKERNSYRLDAAEGHHWTQEGAVTTTHIESIHVHDTVFSEGKTFFYDDPTISDEEHTISLAKGIGFVKMTAWFVNPAQLTRARIGGVEYEF